MPFPNGLRALDHDDFRRFFTAQLASQTVNWMQTVAQSWLYILVWGGVFPLGAFMVGAMSSAGA